MAYEPQLVLDANILIRAVLGQRVRGIIADHVERASFVTPEVAHKDASTYVPALLIKRGRKEEINERSTSSPGSDTQ